MIQTPKVSVIVPNYNHAAYLKQRIDTVLAQSYTDFELILLDDCSTDNSREILCSYQGHPRVSHIVFNEQNSGSTFKQWNKGIALASGKYIWIAESDDFADPEFLEYSVKIMEDNPRVTLAFTGSQLVNEHGHHLPIEWDHIPSGAAAYDIYTGVDFIKQSMIVNNSAYNASMVLFKKECAALVSDAYKQFRYCGDWFFWAEICRMGDVARINRKLNYFRQHTCRVTVNALKEGLAFTEGCRVIGYLLGVIPFTRWERLIVSGRIQKRLYDKKSGGRAFRKRVVREHPKVFCGGKFAILAYELNKLFR